MGEIQKRPFQLSFNASLRVDFQGSRVASDGGLILVRELDERLGFDKLAADALLKRERRTHSYRLLICCDNPSSAAWRDTRI